MIFDGLSPVFYCRHLVLFVYSAEGIAMRKTLCYFYRHQVRHTFVLLSCETWCFIIIRLTCLIHSDFCRSGDPRTFKVCHLLLTQGRRQYVPSVMIGLLFNPSTPNDPYSGRTAPLTSKRCILYIYSTNIGNEYFKHGKYSPFFFSSKCSLFHNSNIFGSCFINILYKGCAKIKKK